MLRLKLKVIAWLIHTLSRVAMDSGYSQSNHEVYKLNRIGLSEAETNTLHTEFQEKILGFKVRTTYAYRQAPVPGSFAFRIFHISHWSWNMCFVYSQAFNCG